MSAEPSTKNPGQNASRFAVAPLGRTLVMQAESTCIEACSSEASLHKS